MSETQASICINSSWVTGLVALIPILLKAVASFLLRGLTVSTCNISPLPFGAVPKYSNEGLPVNPSIYQEVGSIILEPSLKITPWPVATKDPFFSLSCKPIVNTLVSDE